MDQKVDEIVHFLKSYETELEHRTASLSTDLRAGKDRVVNFLKPDDPLQFVLRGLMLCEEQMKEIVSKHLPDIVVDRDNIPGHLTALLESGLLEKAEVPPYKRLNKLRNDFAHIPDLQLSSKMARDLYNILDLEQRRHMKRLLNVDSSDISKNPTRLVKAVILRLYMHLEKIRTSEDLKTRLKAVMNTGIS